MEMYNTDIIGSLNNNDATKDIKLTWQHSLNIIKAANERHMTLGTVLAL
jgi:predicted secreted Zn-dependent protease